MPDRRWRWGLSVGAGVVAVGIMAFMWTVSEPRQLLSDFKKAYYPAGALVLNNPAGLYSVFPPKFVNIPIVAWLFTPLSLLSRPLAGRIFTALGLAAVGLACYGLITLTRVAGWKRAAVAGLFIINGPLYNSLREGNLTHFVLLIVCAALWCLEKNRETGAGALLAIAGVLKPPLVLLAAPFLLRRRWRIVAGFGVTVAGIAGLSLAMFGLETHRAWWAHCVQPFAGRPLGAFNVQSVDGVLARLLTGSAHLEDWSPITTLGPAFAAIRAIVVALLVGASAWVCLRAGRPATAAEERLECAIALCLALLISPITWTHYYLLLLLPVALHLGGGLAVPAGRGWSALLGLAVALISLPVTEPSAAGSPVSELLISRYFIGGALLLGLFVAARWRGVPHVH